MIVLQVFLKQPQKEGGGVPTDFNDTPQKYHVFSCGGVSLMFQWKGPQGFLQ